MNMSRLRMLTGAASLLLVPAVACGQAPRSGGITRQDFAARIERRTLAADTDGDGRVSEAEFMAMAKAGRGDPAKRFARLDANHDGAIDRQEVAAHAARRFARMDADHDGVLSPAERAAMHSPADAPER